MPTAHRLISNPHLLLLACHAPAWCTPCALNAGDCCCLQFLVGFAAYLWPTIAIERRVALGPLHRFLGLAVYGTGMAAAAVRQGDSLGCWHGTAVPEVAQQPSGWGVCT